MAIHATLHDATRSKTDRQMVGIPSRIGISYGVSMDADQTNFIIQIRHIMSTVSCRRIPSDSKRGPYKLSRYLPGIPGWVTPGSCRFQFLSLPDHPSRPDLHLTQSCQCVGVTHNEDLPDHRLSEERSYPSCHHTGLFVRHILLLCHFRGTLQLPCRGIHLQPMCTPFYHLS